MWLFALFLCRIVALGVSQNSCGRESIPYLLTVDLGGRPEIACETPACFGPLKSPTPEDYDENGETRNKMRLGAFERTATCTGRFTELPCLANDEWTGGVNEVNNGTHITLTMECCQFQGLNFATEYKTVVLRPGDRFVGGPVKERNRLIAFDLIKEVRKNVSAMDEISYIASVYRMSCVPEPSQFVNKVDANLESGEYLTKQLGNTNNKRGHAGSTRKGHYHYPRHFSSHGDYDDSRERNENRVRPRYESRARYSRRRYHKPSADDYDYYEMEPVPAVRRAMYKRLRAKYDEDQLWPIAYASKTKSKTHGLRSYNNDFGKELNDNKLPQIFTETQAPPVVLPASHRDTYVQPQITSPPLVAAPAQAVAPLSLIPAYSVQPIYSNNVVDQSNYVQQQQVAPSYSGSYDTVQPSACSDTCSGSYAYGSSSSCCSMNSAFSSMQCFSGEMLVRTSSGEKRMDELEIGDLVESIDGAMISYSPIVMFLHRKVQEPAVYFQFRTSTHDSIKLTPYHLIYVSKCQPNERLKLVRATDVKVGECVHVVKGSILHSTRVISIEQVEDIGIYAPLTANGNIVVNSVLASCHSNLAAQTLQQSFFVWWQELNSIVQRVRQSVFLVFGGASHDQKHNLKEEALPFGVEYLVTILDLLVPSSVFM